MNGVGITKMVCNKRPVLAMNGVGIPTWSGTRGRFWLREIPLRRRTLRHARPYAPRRSSFDCHPCPTKAHSRTTWKPRSAVHTAGSPRPWRATA